MIYGRYMAYLQGDNPEKKGYKDTASSLYELPSCIRKAAGTDTRVVVIGIQSLVKAERDGIAEAMKSAKHVTGIFIHGDEAYYRGEAADIFEAIAKASGRNDWAGVSEGGSGAAACVAAQELRKKIFNPEWLKKADEETAAASGSECVQIREAPDSSAEFEFIAREINRLIFTDRNLRYRDIAVLVPDLGSCEEELSRVFRNYGIPHYAGRKYPLGTHPLSMFVKDFLSCMVYGCRPEDVDNVIASPFISASVSERMLKKWAAAQDTAHTEAQTCEEQGAAQTDGAQNTNAQGSSAGLEDEYDEDGDWDIADSDTDDAYNDIPGSSDDEEDVADAVADTATDTDTGADTGTGAIQDTKKASDWKINLKNIFRIYMLRYGNYTGAVMKDFGEKDRLLCEDIKCDYDAVRFVRSKFMELNDLYTANGGRYAGMKEVLNHVNAAWKTTGYLAKTAGRIDTEETKAYNAVYNRVLDVLQDADRLAGNLSDTEYLGLVRSGLSSVKISVSSQHTDDVYVADFSSKVNACVGSSDKKAWTGSKVLFCARLTNDVPAVKTDDAFLSDADLKCLGEKLGTDALSYYTAKHNNSLNRERAAINVCSFSEKLYLSYPTEIDGEKKKPSEIVSYAKSIFRKEAEVIRADTGANAAAATAYAGSYELYDALDGNELYHMADEASLSACISKQNETFRDTELIEDMEDRSRALDKSHARDLYLYKGYVSPTTIEEYFECPYMMFLSKGIEVQETREGCVQALDTGNFVHNILKEAAKDMDSFGSFNEFLDRVHAVKDEQLQKAPFVALDFCSADTHTKDVMCDDLDKVAEKVYDQHMHTLFKPYDTEEKISLTIQAPSGEMYTIEGRTDRIDTYPAYPAADASADRTTECAATNEVTGDSAKDGTTEGSTPRTMVRIIDYKTGGYDAGYTSYYLGKKLQTQLYLLAAAKETDAHPAWRPVAGLYFPLKVSFSKSNTKPFRLEGFMDESESVHKVIFKDLQDGKGKEEYIKGKEKSKDKSNIIFGEADFSDFLDYAKVVSAEALDEMTGGYISPSPAQDACKYCRYKGICCYETNEYGERLTKTGVTAAKIESIAHPEREHGSVSDNITGTVSSGKEKATTCKTAEEGEGND